MKDFYRHDGVVKEAVPCRKADWVLQSNFSLWDDRDLSGRW